LISGEPVGGEDGEERRCSVQNRGEARSDLMLPPDDETEGNGVVDKSHDKEGTPQSGVLARQEAHGPGTQPETQAAEAHSKEDNCEDRQILERHGIEKERSSPDDA